MRPFLKQVAEHYLEAGGLDSKCFIFPNRRSAAFFKKYLSDIVAASPSVDRPFVMPRLLTINDFFSRMYGAPVSDKVSLVLELYECYKEQNTRAESLDDFIFWGDVLLGDFSDVDKYLVDPGMIFTDVSDFRSLQEGYDFLEEDQLNAVKAFVAHFREGNILKVDPDSDKPGVKEKFLRMWNILGPLYKSFNERLTGKGMAYEGMAYRSLAEKVSASPARDVARAVFPETEKYVFVGLNALNECEKKVMGRFRDARIAEFCWDYGDGMISDPANKSSFFMSRNVSAFPQAFEPDPDGTGLPEINVVSVPSSIGQVKLVPDILRKTGDLSLVGTLGSGLESAIVLPDESLLSPLLDSIPGEIADINVTMGCPMTGSAFFYYMSEGLAAQLHIRLRDGQAWFNHRQVWALLSSSLFRTLASEEDLEVASAIRDAAKYYVPESDFARSPLLSAILRPVVKDPKAADASIISALCEWQAGLIRDIGRRLIQSEAAVEAEYARRYLRCVNILKGKELPILPATYVRLLGQLVSLESVPFEGEPLRGLQIMGPLETRALDFPNLIVLSCNEGVFPGRSVAASMIPPEIRRGFGLPTYEYQDAVWAYYFYRMIRRAERVWLIYDSRTESMKPGEESRFIKQMQYHFRVPIRRFVTMGPAGIAPSTDLIPKPADIRERLLGTAFSASSLKNYLICPAKFYYHSVERLHPEDEVSESLDASMLGNVYHAVMQALYLGPVAMDPDFSMDPRDIGDAIKRGVLRPLREISRGYIESWLGRKDALKARLRSLVLKELRAAEVSGRDIVTEDIILRYVIETLRYDLGLLREKGLESFRILGLELQRNTTIDGFRFTGKIDRLDSFGAGSVRVVDYKTGLVGEEDIIINDENARDVVGKLFGPSNAKRPSIALQLYLYDKFISSDEELRGCSIENVIYAPGRLATKGALSSGLSVEFQRLMEEKLPSLLEGIADPEIPFRRIEEDKTCKWCDFKGICGRKGTDYYK